MRIRTPVMTLAVAAAIVAAGAAGSLPVTSWADASTSSGTAADATTQASYVSACPDAAPPLASCFAKYQAGPSMKTGGTPAGYSPEDLRSAYNLPSSGGSGEVLAIVNAFSNPNVESDLATYRSQFGLPACTIASGCLRILNQNGATSPLPKADAGWGMEMMLDLDVASAVCPNCKLLLVQADSNRMDDLGIAVDTAVSKGATVVSNSYGSNGEFSAEVNLESHYNHPGHAIVASSGDSGYMVSFPAVSRYVTAVGGTTLRRDSNGKWSETAWSGAGSGCSAYVPKPSWQTDTNCSKRMVADIAAVADPHTGVAVYDTYGHNGWLTAGGTSAASPLIAGIYALTGTSGKVKDGSAPWVNHARAGAFRDITSGSNLPSNSQQRCSDYRCTGVSGYDGPTGWGSPLGTGGLTVN